jgi:tol-pal system protein YbgF
MGKFSSTILVTLLLGLSGCVTTDQLNPVVSKVNNVDERVARMERVFSNQALLDLSQRLEALQNEVRALRGRVDELQFNLQKAQTQQRDLYQDLDKRLQAVAAGGGPRVSGSDTVAPPGQSAGGVNAGDEKASYQAAFDLLKDSKYAPAAGAFKQFLTNYPDSPLADNAHYWLGETYFVTKDYAQALGAFQTVVTKFPESRKIADALLKIGYCNYELKKWGEARDALGQLVQQYPETPSAKLASQRLAKMQSEGH